MTYVYGRPATKEEIAEKIDEFKAILSETDMPPTREALKQVISELEADYGNKEMPDMRA